MLCCVNAEWMRARLEALLTECVEYERLDRGGWNEAVLGPIMRRVHEQVPTARRIVEALDASLIPEDFGINVYMSGLHSTENTLRQALGLLRDLGELLINLAPDAPSLIADQLHPIVWQAAAPLWATGEYKAAATNSAVSLSAHNKKRVASHLNERELVQQVFSPDLPKADGNRLHLPGDRKDKTWKSAQEGLHLIAQGAFAGIRNPAVHVEGQWPEHVALEHLAVLSVVARWVDQTDVVQAS